MHFYVNTMTGHTQWEPPAPAASSLPVSPAPTTIQHPGTLLSPANAQPTPTQQTLMASQQATSTSTFEQRAAVGGTAPDAMATRLPTQDGFISSNNPMASTS